MRVLLIGGGGREHAIGWKLVQESVELTSLPGNPGLAAIGDVIEGIQPTDVGAVAAMAATRAFDLVVVGPEAPLAAGIVDALDRSGVPVFGPTRAAAQLESSKAFAKTVMDEAGVLTAGWSEFQDRSLAHDYVDSADGPFVVKADGLAAGKGVLVTESRPEAHAWVDDCLGGTFGDAGSRVVIEEFLGGPELSVFALCDGVTAIPLEPARDYKRAGDGDVGPNTGGMGSYSPVSDLPAGIVQYTVTEVVKPVLQVMADRGTPYRGFLYTGYVLTEAGPRVLEFNCRLGDPETQVVLARMESSLSDLMNRSLLEGLEGATLDWSDQSVVNVVMAAPGYPVQPKTGDLIHGDLRERPGSTIFHAGTRATDQGLVTAGGRVLNVVGRADDLAGARDTAYERVATISWPGAQYRTDIAGET